MTNTSPCIASSENIPAEESSDSPLSLKIEKLIYGGNGLGRLGEEAGERAGAVVFAPFSAPGDTIKALIDFSQKPFTANSFDIEVPSQQRVTPPCPVFGECGGCHWQHLSSEAQLEWKGRIVQEALERLGKFKNIVVESVLSANSWGYRHKIQWQVQPDGKLAYYAQNSHDPVVFGSCAILSPALQEVATLLQSKAAQAMLAQAEINKITAKNNSIGQLLLVFHTQQAEDSTQHTMMPLVELLSTSLGTLQGIILEQTTEENRKQLPSYTILDGQDYLNETIAGVTYQVHWRSFFQVNPQAAELLLKQIRQCLTDVPEKKHVLDLYGGVGTFAASLADLFEHISLIESHPNALDDACANLPKRSTIIDGTIEQIINNLSKEFSEPIDVVLLDPPRKGCHPRVIDWVSKNAQSAIVYVSCDPTTLARDLNKLCAAGWKIQTVQPIDMFPQTYHIETVVLLVPSA